MYKMLARMDETTQAQMTQALRIKTQELAEINVQINKLASVRDLSPRENFTLQMSRATIETMENDLSDLFNKLYIDKDWRKKVDRLENLSQRHSAEMDSLYKKAQTNLMDLDSRMHYLNGLSSQMVIQIKLLRLYSSSIKVPSAFEEFEANYIQLLTTYNYNINALSSQFEANTNTVQRYLDISREAEDTLNRARLKLYKEITPVCLQEATAMLETAEALIDDEAEPSAMMNAVNDCSGMAESAIEMLDFIREFTDEVDATLLDSVQEANTLLHQANRLRETLEKSALQNEMASLRQQNEKLRQDKEWLLDIKQILVENASEESQTDTHFATIGTQTDEPPQAIPVLTGEVQTEELPPALLSPSSVARHASLFKIPQVSLLRTVSPTLNSNTVTENKSVENIPSPGKAQTNPQTPKSPLTNLSLLSPRTSALPSDESEYDMLDDALSPRLSHTYS
jgi:hypothetical protein